MSRRLSDDEYRKTTSFRFEEWLSGSKDPYLGEVEVQPPREQPEIEERRNQRKAAKKLLPEILYDMKHNTQVKAFKRIYSVFGVAFCVLLVVMLLTAVSNLPIVGQEDRPANNEVSQKYIEDGLQDTGSINIVTGMILDYRAFDTLGESHVLFVATCTVLILLRIDTKEKKSRLGKIAEEVTDDRVREPKNDRILQMVARLLVPPIVIFGMYVVLFGHLGPGGGFSGGAIIGAGLILYLEAFGFAKTERFFKESTYKKMSFGALTCYCVAKSYSFYTGANHIHSVIPLGTPGAILSSGLILILNICVGIVVAGTMYTFYVMFRKGGY